MLQTYRTLGESWQRRVGAEDHTFDSDWIRLDNFGCNTPEALASLLGGQLHIWYADYSGSTTSITIDKATYEQGILFLCRNGGTPSIFAYNRTNVYTVYEGGVLLNSVSIDSSGAKIIVTKDASSLLYVSIIRLY